jgi:hypothetical protein
MGGRIARIDYLIIANFLSLYSKLKNFKKNCSRINIVLFLLPGRESKKHLKVDSNEK